MSLPKSLVFIGSLALSLNACARGQVLCERLAVCRIPLTVTVSDGASPSCTVELPEVFVRRRQSGLQPALLVFELTGSPDLSFVGNGLITRPGRHGSNPNDHFPPALRGIVGRNKYNLVDRNPSDDEFDYDVEVQWRSTNCGKIDPLIHNQN